MRDLLNVARLQDNRAMLEAIDGVPADPVRLGPPPDEAEGRHVQSIEPAIRTELEGGHPVWWLPRRAHLGDPAQRRASGRDNPAAHQVADADASRCSHHRLPFPGMNRRTCSTTQASTFPTSYADASRLRHRSRSIAAISS